MPLMRWEGHLLYSKNISANVSTNKEKRNSEHRRLTVRNNMYKEMCKKSADN